MTVRKKEGNIADVRSSNREKERKKRKKNKKRKRKNIDDKEERKRISQEIKLQSLFKKTNSKIARRGKKKLKFAYMNYRGILRCLYFTDNP